MKVSVIVPVYNIEEYLLKRCVDSLLQQTLDDMEIILVDDGGPAKCGAICDEYGLLEDGVKVIHQSNKGVSVARNVGISMASGDYIIFVDADDYVAHDMCEMTYKCAVLNKSDILFFKYTTNQFTSVDERGGGITSKDSNLRELQLEVIDHLRARRHKGYHLAAPWAKVFSTEFIKKNSLCFQPGLKRSEDALFLLNCLEHSPEVCFFDYVGYYYNTSNEESASRKFDKDMVSTGNEMMDSIWNFIQLTHADDSQYIDAFDYFCVDVFFNMIYLFFYNKNNIKSYAERKNAFFCILDNERIDKSIKKIDVKVFDRRRQLILKLLKYEKRELVSIILELNRIKNKLKVVSGQ